jgi:hypothetical protein
MRQHFTVKFVWAAVLLAPIVVAGGGPAFAAPSANNDVRACNHQAGKIVSLNGPLRVIVSRDGVTAGSGGKAALAAAGPCTGSVASTAQGGVVTRGVSDQPAMKNPPKKR